MNPRRIQDLDLIIGQNIRTHRITAGLSQDKLGWQIGDISYQQIQKYESGANRISASRLMQVAEVLGKPITAFYPGGEIQSEDGEKIERLADWRILKAFNRIRNQKQRSRILALIQALGEVSSEEQGAA